MSTEFELCLPDFKEEKFDRITSDDTTPSAFDSFIYEHAQTPEEFRAWKSMNLNREGVVLGVGEEFLGSVMAFAYAHSLKPFSELGENFLGWSCRKYIDEPLQNGEIVVFLLPPNKMFSHKYKGFTWKEVSHILEHAFVNHWESIFFIEGAYDTNETAFNWDLFDRQ